MAFTTLQKCLDSPMLTNIEFLEFQIPKDKKFEVKFEISEKNKIEMVHHHKNGQN
jgi:hypothetical protein